MAVSAQLESVKQMMRSLGERAESLGTVDGFRLAFEEVMSQFSMEDDIVCERLGAGGSASRMDYGPRSGRGPDCAVLARRRLRYRLDAWISGPTVSLVAGIGEPRFGDRVPACPGEPFSCGSG